MPTDTRHRTTLGNRFRFFMRVVGLTGALAVAVGGTLAAVALPPVAEWTPEIVQAAAKGESTPLAQVAAITLAAGVVAIALALLSEFVGVLVLATGRKTVANTASTVQVALAVALLVVVNAIGFTTYARYDTTATKQFTLTPDQQDKLRKLRPDATTTVVVLQLHKTAGILSDKPDVYDFAAERKVVEKVNDLVDELREFGPRFNVVVLDVAAKGYQKALDDLTRRRPGLAEAIAAAPENSIFFYADAKVRRVAAVDLDPKAASVPDPDASGRDLRLVYGSPIGRMGFGDFYQLDKTASRQADDGRGNLVLIPRGKDAFVSRVLAVEERKPKVGLAVIHPFLAGGQESYDDYTATGLRKALEANGFQVTDVILKKWGRGGPPSAAADTFEEYELERVEGRYRLFSQLSAISQQQVRAISTAKATAERALAAAEKAPPADRAKALVEAFAALQPFVRGRIQTEGQVREVLAQLPEVLTVLKQEADEIAKQLADAGPKLQELLKDERATENRRVTDITAKLSQYVADCDVLIVPRLTVVDLVRGDTITPSLFNLSKEQAEAIRAFVAAGKPVLCAFGPPVGGRGPVEPPDEVEGLLARLGIILGNQAVLTNKEATAMAERMGETLGGSADVPPVLFDLSLTPDKKDNPIAAAVRTTARAVDRTLELKKSGYRPIYLAKGVASRLPFAAEVMHSTADSWNEERPLPEGDEVPKFEPTKPGDPKKGTLDEERRGPFPVGVAVETPVPAEWVTPKLGTARDAAAVLAGGAGVFASLGVSALDPANFEKPPATTKPVRVVALGHGGLFTGKQLSPGQETLVLHSLNWAVGRDDRLPTNTPDSEKWAFPRAALSPDAAFVWRWATFLGLPLLAVYFGITALMLRKMR